MSVLIAGISPHPPLIIPEVGGAEIARVQKTVDALKKMCSQIAAAGAETIIFITPHGPMFREAVAIIDEPELEGDFRSFGASRVRLRAKNDLELVRAITEESNKAHIEVVLIKKQGARFIRGETTLDHGITVPLYYLQEAGAVASCLAITFALLPSENLFHFGQAIKKATEVSGRKVAVVASGDMSHRLTRDAPAGYNPKGKEFDQTIIEYLRSYRVKDLLSLDSGLVSAAGECGLRSIIIMLGALADMRIRPEILSYEGPFGVGYLVALFTPEEPAAKEE